MKQGKTIRIATGIVLFAIAGMFITGIMIRKSVASHRPPLPDMHALPQPVQEQLVAADQKANRYPTHHNIGKLGMAYHSASFYKEALACYQLAAGTNQSDWIWHYYLGYLNSELGNSQDAIRNYQTVTSMAPKVHHAWYYLGEEYKNLGKIPEAEEAFEKISDLPVADSHIKPFSRTDYFSLSTYARYQLARLYADADQPDKAEKMLQDLIQNNRAFGPAYRLLGTIYKTWGDALTGNRYTTRANDLTIFSPPVDTLIDKLTWISRSENYLLKKIDEAENGVYPEWALELVKHGLQYMPDNKYLLSKAIHFFLITNSGDRSLPYLDKHRAAFQSDYHELRSVADLLYTKNFYSQSLDYYIIAKDLNNAETDIYSCIALCLWNIGKKKQALDTVNTLLERSPGNSNLLAESISLFITFGDYTKAKSCLEDLRQLSPNDPKTLKYSGMIAEHNGDIKRATVYYEEAFSHNPEDMVTIRNLTGLYIQQRRWEECIVFLRRALNHHPNDPFLLERLGTLLVTCPQSALRNIREGKELSERAFIHTASHSTTLVSAGRSFAIACASLGDKAKACQVLQMTINLAQQENISKGLQAELMKLFRQFSR